MTHAWWWCFGVLTFFAIYLGNVFVGIWGEKEAALPVPPKPQTTEEVLNSYYGSKATNNE